MVPLLREHDPFPPVTQALGADSVAPGLLAMTERVTPQRILEAYRLGIFPWYSAGQPVLWWSPDPRMVLHPVDFRVSVNLRKFIRQVLHDDDWAIQVDKDFSAVMQSCAETPRPGQHGTWITHSMIAAYSSLHRQNQAHSIEVWHQKKRVAGLYGVAIGRMFFGESMFTRCNNGSKLALAALCAFLMKNKIVIADCQQETAHLRSLGATPITRDVFVNHVQMTVVQRSIVDWQFDKYILQAWA